jgi:hypothetical protein
MKSALGLPEIIENPALMESPMTPKHSISLGWTLGLTVFRKKMNGMKSLRFIK